jgi:hypothetical protein
MDLMTRGFGILIIINQHAFTAIVLKDIERLWAKVNRLKRMEGLAMGELKDIQIDLLDKIESMKVLDIKAGDVLVVRVNHRVPIDRIALIGDQVKNALQLTDEINALVINDDLDVAVIRKG